MTAYLKPFEWAILEAVGLFDLHQPNRGEEDNPSSGLETWAHIEGVRWYPGRGI
jgi:hypothetical protein